MKKLISKLFDIREGEGARAFLMFAFIFFLIASFLIIKPVRDALFLDKHGSKKLPFVYILVALFSACVASLYARYSKKVKLHVLVLTTLLISIATIIIFWFLLYSGYQGEWFLYAFYVWVSIFGVITGAQFWLLANDVFNAREAKRLFGFIGIGAILGGVFGGYLTSFLAVRLRTENLLFVCILFLSVCTVLLWLVRKKNVRSSPKKSDWRRKYDGLVKSPKNSLQLILESRHLALLAGIIGVGVVVANLVDYQFNAVAESIISDADKLAGFFGFWNSTLNILSLFIQLFLTTRILKHFGVSASLFFMPVALLLGAVVFLVSPALWSAILIKMSDGGFKHSINKAGIELLAVPISEEIKVKTKSFIDIFIKNLAQGIGGVLLIALILGLGFSIALVSLITLVMLAGWIYMIVRIKTEYINSFRQAIEKRTIDIDEQVLNLDDAAVFQSFAKILDGKGERQILYVLKLLEDSKNEELIPYLERLIRNPSPEIKTLVLKIASRFDDLDLTSEAAASILSVDQELQIQALQYLYLHSKYGISFLKKYLSHEDYRVRMASMICISSEWKNNQDLRAEIDLKGLLEGIYNDVRELDSGDEQQRNVSRAVAKIIGITNNEDLYPFLFTLINHESSEVIKETVVTMGKTQAEEFIPVLMDRLSTKHIRKYSREALAEYGEKIIDRLSDVLGKNDEEREKRRSIPKVLALIGTQKSVSILLDNLNERDLVVRYETLKALNKLRARFPNYKFDRNSIEERIEIESQDFVSLAVLLENYKRHYSALEMNHHERSQMIQKAWSLLIRALEEKIDQALERIFRLLALKYGPRDLFHAYLGIKSEKSNLRANALEFLDNILDPNIKKILIPTIEATDGKSLDRSFNKFAQMDSPTIEECHSRILRGNDSWLKVCTLHLLTELGENRQKELVSALSDDPSPLVREMSMAYLLRIENLKV